MWIGVDQVGAERSGGDDRTESVHAPAEGEDVVVPVVLEGAADEVEAEDVKGRHKPEDDEACLGFDTAIVSFGVEGADEVVQPVAGDLAEGCAEDRRDVDGGEVAEGELVFWDDEDGNRSVVTDHPGEGEEVVDASEKDGQSSNGERGPDGGAKERVAGVVRAHLFDADESHQSRFAGRDLLGFEVPGVKCLVTEEDGQDPGDAGNHGTEAHAPPPRGY